MSSTVPRGIQAAVASGNVGLGLSTTPGALAALPMYSPRLVGEGAMKIGEGARAVSPVTEAVAPSFNAAQRLLQERSGAIRGTLAGSRLAGQTARADDDLLTEEQLELLRQPR